MKVTIIEIYQHNELRAKLINIHNAIQIRTYYVYIKRVLSKKIKNLIFDSYCLFEHKDDLGGQKLKKSKNTFTELLRLQQ